MNIKITSCPRWIQRIVGLFRPTSPTPPIEIQEGQVWGRSWDKGNPFAEWFSVVEDVRDGWVKFRATNPKDGYDSKSYSSMAEAVFRDTHSKPVALPNIADDARPGGSA